jgi:hypothetical protein
MPCRVVLATWVSSGVEMLQALSHASSIVESCRSRVEHLEESEFDRADQDVAEAAADVDARHSQLHNLIKAAQQRAGKACSDAERLQVLLPPTETICPSQRKQHINTQKQLVFRGDVQHVITRQAVQNLIFIVTEQW